MTDGNRQRTSARSARSCRRHHGLPRPTIDDILSRIEGDEFTTTEFIALLQSDPEANAAYLEALRRWGEGDRSAKMVIHGQVIPGSCAGRIWSSGSDLLMAKTIRTRYPGAGAWSEVGQRIESEPTTNRVRESHH